MLLLEAEPIPERITAVDKKLVHLANLSAPIDRSFPDWLRAKGLVVEVEHEFDWPGLPEEARGKTPLLRSTVYEWRNDVQLPQYPVDPRLRSELTQAAVRLESTQATDALFSFQGGQKGRQKGGIHVYPDYGPLIVSTAIDHPTANLQAVVTTYWHEFRKKMGSHGEVRYDEQLFEASVNLAMGVRNTERSRIPVGNLYLQDGDDNWIPHGHYFPDSHVVTSIDGHMLPYAAGDGKSRAGVAWKDLDIFFS
ncbi:hypothetical protein HY409_00060 [Candidatus Gottesmanbacteria bacterium]|nr:hypothetical protein [Candidatus Gottesmanbacteria bacterium]